MNSSITRRSFLQSMLAASAAPFVLRSSLVGKTLPSGTVTMGFIGVGDQGFEYNMKMMLNHPEARVVAVCDVFQDRMVRAKSYVDEHFGNEDCRMVRDFRDVLADPSIDAVVVSTPDHWHVLMATMALKAGKHVLCEKPTLTIAEGRELVDAVKASGKVFATGLEDRSLIHYHRLVEIERNGGIGDLKHVEVTIPRGFLRETEEVAPIPEGLDYKMWLGPAPFHPYTPTRTDPMHWRYIRDYSTGMITDWGTHLGDTAMLAINDPLHFPTEISGSGEQAPSGLQSDLPAVFEVNYGFSNGKTMRLKTGKPNKAFWEEAVIRLEGTEGWIEVEKWRGVFKASDRNILRQRYQPDSSKHWKIPPLEHRNFLDAILHGIAPTYPVETLHHLSSSLIMGLISIDLGRPLKWDSEVEQFVGDIEATQLCHRNRNTDWIS